MTKDEATLLELTKEILKVHSSLQGVPVAKAEIQYIKEVQLLDGYGMEYYLAKVITASTNLWVYYIQYLYIIYPQWDHSQ